MDLGVSAEIDQQLQTCQNLQEVSKFFLNTKMGYLVRKIPQAELKQVDLQEDSMMHKAFMNPPQTPLKSLNSANKRPVSFNTAKFQQVNLTSIIEQREKRASIEMKPEESEGMLSQGLNQASQLQKILDVTSFEQYSKVVQVLKLRKSCLNVNKQLHILCANDKLLKKKVQLHE